MGPDLPQGVDGDDLGGGGGDGALGEHEAPEDQAEGAALGGEPVGHAGVAVGDDDPERAIALERALGAVEADRAAEVVEGLELAVPERDAGAAALGPGRGDDKG